MEAAPNREHIRNMAEARAHVKRDGGCYIRPIFWPLPRPTTVHGIRHKGRLRKRAHSPRRGQGWSACVAVSHQRQFRRRSADAVGFVRIQDRDALAPVLGAVHRKSPWVTMSFVDSGYQGDEAQRAAYEASRITITVVKRTDTTVKGFIVLPKRWVVERTLGWINRARRLSKDFEATIESSVRAAMRDACRRDRGHGR